MARRLRISCRSASNYLVDLVNDKFKQASCKMRLTNVIVMSIDVSYNQIFCVLFTRVSDSLDSCIDEQPRTTCCVQQKDFSFKRNMNSFFFYLLVSSRLLFFLLSYLYLPSVLHPLPTTVLPAAVKFISSSSSDSDLLGTAIKKVGFAIVITAVHLVTITISSDNY